MSLWFPLFNNYLYQKFHDFFFKLSKLYYEKFYLRVSSFKYSYDESTNPDHRP